jgi:energy-coupling factor transport system substrate-specific component
MAPAEGLAFAPGDPVNDNVRRFGVYTLLTSTGSFDTGRAITRPAVLTTLRHAARKVRIDTRC